MIQMQTMLEVDGWTGFSRHFKHLKSGATAEDQHLLLTTILADAINLGLSKMAESCPGVTYAKLTWLQAWHIRLPVIILVCIYSVFSLDEGFQDPCGFQLG
jgi:hypothetical protein